MGPVPAGRLLVSVVKVNGAAFVGRRSDAVVR
jgi:hypothetical protein